MVKLSYIIVSLTSFVDEIFFDIKLFNRMSIVPCYTAVTTWGLDPSSIDYKGSTFSFSAAVTKPKPQEADIPVPTRFFVWRDIEVSALPN